MTKKDILNKIAEKEKLLHFSLSDKQKEIFIQNFANYQARVDAILKFDFSKHIPYWKPTLQENRTISFSQLRVDESNDNQNNCVNELFVNSINFKDGYVVIKNEKKI